MLVPTLMTGAKISNKLVALTWNANWLGPKKMQLQFLSYFRKSKANLIILVDTRLQVRSRNVLKKLWDGQAFFNSRTSNSRCIAILMKDDLEVEYVEFKNVLTGNLSRLKFAFMDEKYLINCIYATNNDFSNDDTKKFFKDVFDNSYFHEYKHMMCRPL